jgi:ABC-type dipeptide/oligopeptide/nickel transport system permease subunit
VINRRHSIMNNLIWLVGAVVIVLAILSFLGLR